MPELFQKGTILIPAGHHYPDGALTVDGYDQSGNLLAHPLGGGFQYVIGPERVSSMREVRGDERQAAFYRHAKFAVDGVDGVFAGWMDGRRWNGWAMPYFERREAERVAGLFDARYDAGRDAYITISQDGEEEVWAAVDITVADGTSIRAYPIGAGAWIWDDLDMDLGQED